MTFRNGETAASLAKYYGFQEVVTLLDQHQGTAQEPDIVLGNDQFVIDNGNKKTTYEEVLKKMKLQTPVVTPYIDDFAGRGFHSHNNSHSSEHWNLIGKDTTHGVVLVSVTPCTSGHRMLIRDRNVCSLC